MNAIMRAQPCPDCKAMMLGGPVTEQGKRAPHGARASGDTGLVCRHGAAWMRDCINRPIPPSCCRNLPDGEAHAQAVPR